MHTCLTIELYMPWMELFNIYLLLRTLDHDLLVHAPLIIVVLIELQRV